MIAQAETKLNTSTKWTKELVQEHAITAVAVEMYTLPFYLTVMTSIVMPDKDDTSIQAKFTRDVYKVILSVCIEEMLHLELAANLCLALDVNPSDIFQKPTYGVQIKYLDPYDPVTNHNRLLNAKLGPLNSETLGIMLDIETPTEFDRQNADFKTPNYPYKTIGQMYEALLHGILEVEKDGPVFGWSTVNQLAKFTWGPDFTKNALRINQTIASFGDAQQAVNLICGQGEGITRQKLPQKPYKASQFPVEEAYRFYPRVETTSNNKNPEPDDPASLNGQSHYGRFLWIENQINNGDRAWPETYPISSEPTTPELSMAQSTALSMLMEGFDSFIDMLTSMWSGGDSSDFFTAMYKLKPLPTNCWKAGVVPQWSWHLPSENE